jgi:hypothetical protein
MTSIVRHQRSGLITDAMQFAASDHSPTKSRPSSRFRSPARWQSLIDLSQIKNSEEDDLKITTLDRCRFDDERQRNNRIPLPMPFERKTIKSVQLYQPIYVAQLSKSIKNSFYYEKGDEFA